MQRGELSRDKESGQQGDPEVRPAFAIIEEDVPGGSAIRVVTGENDCVWAVGTKEGLRGVLEELKAIRDAYLGRQSTSY